MQTSLVTVPQDGTLRDVLAKRYRAAFDKVNGGRAQWIEGTLELAAVLADGRIDMPDHREFSRWVEQYQLEPISKDSRWALLGIAEANQKTIRTELEQSNSLSWEVFWRKSPQRTLRKIPKGAKTSISRRSGASQRKRAARHHPALDPADDDATPAEPKRVARHMPPPEPGKTLSDMGLSREQVDADFVGDAIAFATKYGHVNLHTKSQIEHRKQQEMLSAWVGAVADLDRASRAMLTALAAVDPATLQEWTRKPLKAEKMRAWCNSIQVACEAVRKLCPTESSRG